MAKTGPVVEDSGSLLLEYVNGSACTTSDQKRTTYTTRIHLVCTTGSLVRGRGSAAGLACSGSPVCAGRGSCLVLLEVRACHRLGEAGATVLSLSVHFSFVNKFVYCVVSF